MIKGMLSLIGRQNYNLATSSKNRATSSKKKERDCLAQANQSKWNCLSITCFAVRIPHLGIFFLGLPNTNLSQPRHRLGFQNGEILAAIKWEMIEHARKPSKGNEITITKFNITTLRIIKTFTFM